MSKLPSSWPKCARKGGPNWPTADRHLTELGALKPYVFRHSMRAPVCRCSPARFFEKGALSLQSCAFWRTQPASFPLWTTNFYDFFGFCPWRLAWLFNSVQFNPIQSNSIQFNPIQSNSVQSNQIQSNLRALPVVMEFAYTHQSFSNLVKNTFSKT